MQVRPEARFRGLLGTAHESSVFANVRVIRPRALHRHCLSRNFEAPAVPRRALLGLSSLLLVAPSCRGALVDEGQAEKVFADASPSVVTITIYNTKGGVSILEGTGSGFVWDQYGHVVTNYHCISKTMLNKQQVVQVGLDGSSSSTLYPAQVIGTDAMHDLAVLAIEDVPKDIIVPIRVGESSGLKVGQAVYAIGNPYGLSKTLTAGVVSGLDRTIPAPTGTRIYGAIQTDASVNAGNSGGPLLDSSARLVGVNTATFNSGGGRGSGVNFALPADLVRSIVPNLIVYGNAAGKR